MRVSDKNGISFAGSETLQMPIAATDFCLSRAERMWDGCDLRDLGSPPLHRNLQKPNDRILRSKRNLLAHFSSPIFFSPFFLLPKLLCWDLGSAVCALVDWDEALGSLAVRGTPCPHGLRLMRCKICCGCEHGRLRGQCKECGGSSSFCEHRRQRYYCNCKECSGSSFSASTGGSAASAKSVAAAASASTGARATTATVECGGSSIASTGGCAPPA